MDVEELNQAGQFDQELGNAPRAQQLHEEQQLELGIAEHVEGDEVRRNA